MADGDAILPLTSNGTSCEEILSTGIVDEASNLSCDSHKKAEEISNLSFSKEKVLEYACDSHLFYVSVIHIEVGRARF